MDILEYGVELENKDFLGTEQIDQTIQSLLTPTSEETAVAAPQKQKEKAPEKEPPIDFEKIDNSNKVQLEAEAAISDVEVNRLTEELIQQAASANEPAGDPLQPSSDASLITLYEDTTPKPKAAPAKKPPTVAEVVQKTLSM